MSDDEETVRRRLRWLAGLPEGSPWSAPAPPREPGGRPPAGGPSPTYGPRPGAHEPGGRVLADDPSPADGLRPGAPEPGAGSARRLPGPGAFDPGRRGVRALAVVAAVAVLGAGLWAWRSRPRAEPVPPVATADVPVAGGAVETAAGPSGELVVAVAGKVRRPGLVRLPAGARLADAVEAAGGALPGVDVALLNPARKVADGELIVVGLTPPPGAAQPGAAPGAAPGAGSAPGVGGRLNLNTATLAQLDALPGVGPVLAQRILAHRERQGGFRSVGDLRQVEGIGDARYEQLKDLVTP